jgi:hypothetical protein
MFACLEEVLLFNTGKPMDMKDKLPRLFQHSRANGEGIEMPQKFSFNFPVFSIRCSCVNNAFT